MTEYLALLEHRIFRFALIGSAVFHVVFLVVLWFSNAEYKKNIPPASRVEMVYQAPSSRRQTPVKVAERVEMTRDTPASLPPRSMIHDRVEEKGPGYRIEKQPVRLPPAQSSGPGQPVTIEGKRQISVPVIEAEKISHSRYLTYHDQVRNRIRARAYFYIDNPSFEVGEVYLTFVLKANGQLEAVKIIPEKTRANTFLRSVAVRSIKESAPFPSFPDDLKYPELTFNVVISFEVAE